MLWAKTFILHTMDDENDVIASNPVVLCQHNLPQKECKQIVGDKQLCPTEEDIKYRMVRFSMESVDLYLTEEECSCNIQVSYKVIPNVTAKELLMRMWLYQEYADKKSYG